MFILQMDVKGKLIITAQLYIIKEKQHWDCQWEALACFENKNYINMIQIIIDIRYR